MTGKIVVGLASAITTPQTSYRCQPSRPMGTCPTFLDFSSSISALMVRPRIAQLLRIPLVEKQIMHIGLQFGNLVVVRMNII